MKKITDAGTELSGAKFGAFFYNLEDSEGKSYMLYTLSGASSEAFKNFPQPRATPLFAPTFRGEGVIRLDDVTKDPRYGREAPYHGIPKGHLPVRSYLAAPVVSRTGKVLGGLFFGHPEPAMFGEGSERLITGLASHAGVAIDNAQLFRQVESELAQRKAAEEALRRSEGILSDFFENAAMALHWVGPDGRILHANPAELDLLGYSREEYIGHHISEFHVQPAAIEEVLRRLTCGETVRNYRAALRRKDGSIRQVLIDSNVLWQDSKFVHTRCFTRDITELVNAEDELKSLNATLEQRVAQRTAELEHKTQQLRKLAAELTGAEQRERRRLAHVLHDHLQQLLVASQFEVTHLSHRICSGERTGLPSTERLSELLKQSIEASRSLTVELSPPILYSAGLPAALQWLAKWMNQKHGLEVELRVDGAPEIEAEEPRVLLFTAVRELLFNTVKHSGARSATVTVDSPKDGQIRVTVDDSGAGFDPAVLARGDEREN